MGNRVHILLGIKMLQIAKTLGSVMREAAFPTRNRGEALKVQKLLEKHAKQHYLDPLDKLNLAVLASTWAIANPYQGKGVAILGEITGEEALKQIRNRMLQTKEGKAILKDRVPVFPSHNNHREYNEGTLGKLLDHCVPEERTKVQFIEDPELAFVMRRYRDAHDIIHALTGFPVTVAGEIALKWFEAASTNLPMTTLSAIFGPIRAEPNSSKLLMEWIPWAATAGRKGRFYMEVQYSNYLDYNVDEFREQIMKWPQLPESLKNKDVLKAHYREAIQQALQESRDAVALREEAKKLDGL